VGSHSAGAPIFGRVEKCIEKDTPAFITCHADIPLSRHSQNTQPYSAAGGPYLNPMSEAMVSSPHYTDTA
jgi:hypothetical protein